MGKSRPVPDLRPWPARVTWLALPFTISPAMTDAFAGRSHDVRWTAAVLLWSGWTLTLIALLVPRTASLTALRVTAPLALTAASWAAWAGRPVGVADVVALASAAVAVAAAFSPLTGDVFVDGSSYGPERRMALRAPPALLLGPLPIAWIAAVTSAVSGPLLLAAHQWVAGAVGVAVGAPLVWLALRSLHQLSRRWIVFVPSGMVLHDPVGQPEPTLFLRRSIRRLGPAPAGTQALDLTQGAFGLALQLDLVELTDMVVPRGRSTTETVTVGSLLFTPTRPAALLDEARARRIPVGQSAGPPPSTSSPA